MHLCTCVHMYVVRGDRLKRVEEDKSLATRNLHEDIVVLVKMEHRARMRSGGCSDEELRTRCRPKAAVLRVGVRTMVSLSVCV